MSFDAIAPGDSDRLTNVRWLRDTMDKTRTADVESNGMGVSFQTIDAILAQTDKAQSAAAVRAALHQQRPHFEYLDDPIADHATPDAGIQARQPNEPRPNISCDPSLG